MNPHIAFYVCIFCANRPLNKYVQCKYNVSFHSTYKTVIHIELQVPSVA